LKPGFLFQISLQSFGVAKSKTKSGTENKYVYIMYEQAIKHTPLSRTGSNVYTESYPLCFSQYLPSCAKRKIVLMEGDCMPGMLFRTFFGGWQNWLPHAVPIQILVLPT